MDFAATASYRMNSEKKPEKINKYLDVAINLQKLWKMKVTMIPIVVYNPDALDIETIETSELKMHLEYLEKFLSLRFQWKTSR